MTDPTTDRQAEVCAYCDTPLWMEHNGGSTCPGSPEGVLAMQAAAELSRARRKFGPMASSHEGKAVIEEELDELWSHVKANTGSSAEARQEAIQIAAMALRYAMDVCDA